MVLEVHSPRSDIGSASGDDAPAGRVLKWHRASYDRTQRISVLRKPP